MPTAYICQGVRTPIGRYAGALSSVRPDDLAAHTLATLRAKYPKSDWAAIDEVVLGCANQSGEDNRNVARMALLLSGMPHTVPGVTVNRLCASGMEAVAVAARAIGTGEMSIAIAGGVESMSRAPFVMGKATTPFARNAEIFDTTLGWRFINPVLQKAYGTDSMAETGENVAEDYKIDRETQDKFALWSQQKAAAAQKAGFFAEEIAPVIIPGPKGTSKTVCEDADAVSQGRHSDGGQRIRHQRWCLCDVRRFRGSRGEIRAHSVGARSWRGGRWRGTARDGRWADSSHPETAGARENVHESDRFPGAQ
jgi:acetyl-CoA acetyltransferase family protein